MIVYRIISEWDIGEDYVVFTTHANAITWLENNKRLRALASDDPEASWSMSDVILQFLGDGYLSVQKITVDP
jgi:hypothetical protein